LDTSVADRFKRAARAAGVLAAGVGLVGFAGWLFDVEAVKAFGMGGVTIKADAAVCLVLVGAGLALLVREEGRARWASLLARGAAAAAMIVGAMTLAEHLGGYDLGIDQLQFTEAAGALATASPGRMGPPASISFVLAGAALLLLDVRTRRGRVPAQWLALLVGLIALLPLIGYAYGIQPLYGLARYTGIAAHTSAAIAALAMGLLLARPAEGFMAQVCAADAGGMMARRMLLPAIVIPLGLGWLRTVGERAGWFDASLGRPVLVVSMIVSFATLVWWNARAMSALSGARRRAEAQRGRAEEARRADEEQLRTLIEQSAAGISQLDLDGRFVAVNQRYCELTGYSREELLGMRMVDITHPDDRAESVNGVRRALADGGRFEVEKRYVRKDGTVAWVSVGVNVLRGADGARQSTLGVAIDIDDRKRAEAALHQQARGLRLLADASMRLLASDDPAGPIDDLIRQLGEHLGLEVFACFRVTEDGRRLRLSAAGGMDEAQRAAMAYLDLGQGVCGAVTAARAPMAIEDMARSNDPATALLRSLGVTAYACHPLLARGRLIGTLSFGTRTRARFAAGELDLMRAAADLVAMALDRQRLTAELQRRAAELATASAAKDEFLAVLSHELRTPLAPVLLTASMMEAHPELPDELRADVATIRRNVELESRLIADLLDLTRIEKGKLHLDLRELDLHAVVRSAVDISAPPASASARVVVELAATRCVVRGDATRLSQVFWNLLSNAIKFGGTTGTITVRSCDLVEPARIRVEVADTGVGIDPAVLPRLFRAFEQGEWRAGRPRVGLGLGLSISRRLAEAHGGTITAHSDGPGRGATFTVELPVVDAPAPAVAVVQVQRATGAVRPLRVLLVEDHEPTQRVMERLLTRNGHAVTCAMSAAAAAAAAAAAEFDLIVSDLGLPDGSGLDVLRQLGGRYAGRAIAVTGYGMESDIAASRAAGFAEHLTKPVDLAALEAAIWRVAEGDREGDFRAAGGSWCG